MPLDPTPADGYTPRPRGRPPVKRARHKKRKAIPKYDAKKKFGSQSDQTVDQLTAHKPLSPHGAHPVFPRGSLKRRITRRQSLGKFRLHKPRWIDPFPWIPGTDPEKRFFAALVQRRIYFVFHGGSPPRTNLVALGEPDRDIDFLLPEYGVIIDPYSPFAHSQLDSVVRDARKEAVFAAAGWTTYHPWAIGNGVFVFDQTAISVRSWRGNKPGAEHLSTVIAHARTMGAAEALDLMPLLRAGPRFALTDPADILAKRTAGYRIGAHLGAGANAVALANATRRKPPKLTLKA